MLCILSLEPIILLPRVHVQGVMQSVCPSVVVNVVVVDVHRKQGYFEIYNSKQWHKTVKINEKLTYIYSHLLMIHECDVS